MHEINKLMMKMMSAGTDENGIACVCVCAYVGFVFFFFSFCFGRSFVGTAVHWVKGLCLLCASQGRKIRKIIQQTNCRGSDKSLPCRWDMADRMNDWLVAMLRMSDGSQRNNAENVFDFDNASSANVHYGPLRPCCFLKMSRKRNGQQNLLFRNCLSNRMFLLRHASQRKPTVKQSASMTMANESQHHQQAQTKGTENYDHWTLIRLLLLLLLDRAQ